MRRLYTSHNGLLAGFLRSTLQEHGIACVLKNEFLGGAAGEIPPTECWPELWVVEDADYAHAKAILETTVGFDLPPAENWQCPRCGEALEGQFLACWRCGLSRDSET